MKIDGCAIPVANFDTLKDLKESNLAHHSIIKNRVEQNKKTVLQKICCCCYKKTPKEKTIHDISYRDYENELDSNTNSHKQTSMLDIDIHTKKSFNSVYISQTSSLFKNIDTQYKPEISVLGDNIDKEI